MKINTMSLKGETERGLFSEVVFSCGPCLQDGLYSGAFTEV